MKFSDLVATAKTTDDTKAAAARSLDDATTADSAAHAAVVSALESKPSHQVALVDPSGDVDVYGLNADATDFTLTTIPGDFDVEPPPPPG